MPRRRYLLSVALRRRSARGIVLCFWPVRLFRLRLLQNHLVEASEIFWLKRRCPIPCPHPIALEYYVAFGITRDVAEFIKPSVDPLPHITNICCTTQDMPFSP